MHQLTGLEERKIEFLASRNVHVIERPVNSSNRTPIENLWSWMKREVEKKQPMNKTELEAEIVNVWEGLRQLISKTILGIMIRV